MSRTRLMALMLAAGTLLVFLPAGFCDFINYDDPVYVTSNPFVQGGFTWAGIERAFTTFYAGNWHPLTWLSHMLDCELFGLNPEAHHFINVLWHSANVALLFLWLTRLTGRTAPAAFIAALFAWHPLHVESVAWISERKDVLSTFFALLTLLLYTKYVQEKQRRCLWLALVCFALGLMAKPMLVTLPCVMLLLDFWPLKRLPPLKASLFVEKIPFFALTVVSCSVTFFAQRAGEAVDTLAKIPMLYRLANAPLAVAEYIGKTFVPVNLCVIYPLRPSLVKSEVVAAVILVVVISMVAWCERERRPYLLTGWLWFLGMLVPVIGVVQVGQQALADRYMYLPSVGLFIMLGFLLEEAVVRLKISGSVARAGAVMVCIGCILVTEHQLRFWRNSETLFQHALAVTGDDNSVALLNLGAALADEKRFDEAVERFHQALRLTPGRYQLHNDLANMLEETGQPTAAVAEYREAIRLNPRIPYQHNSLGIALGQMGEDGAARDEFLEAEKLDPVYAWPHVEMARLLLKQGRDADAVAELRTATTLQPENDEILAYAAHVLAADQDAAARDGALALKYALKANAIGGGKVVILDALGMALAETGDYTNATACAQNALDQAMAMQMKDTNQIRLRLESYQKNLPWRESFRSTNPPVGFP